MHAAQSPPSTTTRVAVVILNWNGAAFLERFLPSVLAHSGQDAAIWVADNASTDNSVLYVETMFPQVHILRIPHNMGFAGGYNYALERIEAEYFVLLNQDVEVSPGWLEPLLSCLDSQPDVGAMQPKLLDERHRGYFEYAGAAGGMLDALGYPFCRGRLFQHLEADHGQYDQAAELFWASGAALCIRAALYRALGGLDEDFFAHMEEIDLCWRVRRAGYRIVLAPDSVVYHVGGGSLERDNPRKLYLNFRNNSRMLVKNLPVGRLLWLLPLRLALDSLAAARELFQGKSAMARAALRGTWSIAGKLGYWRRRAREASARVAQCRIGPDRSRSEGWYPGSAVWQVFVRGRRSWSALSGRSEAEP
jgi:GT2 family glycosyltransferase